MAECTPAAVPDATELFSVDTSARWHAPVTVPRVKKSVEITVFIASALTSVANRANNVKKNAGGSAFTLSAASCVESCVIDHGVTYHVHSS